MIVNELHFETFVLANKLANLDGTKIMCPHLKMHVNPSHSLMCLFCNVSIPLVLPCAHPT